MIENVNRNTYAVARRQALSEAKEVYSQLENREIKYKSYKTKVKNIMSKHISNLEKDSILTNLSYVDIEDKRYYVQTFFGDFHFNNVIDINLVDFKHEDINSIDEVPKCDGFMEQRFVKEFHNGNVENFSI